MLRLPIWFGVALAIIALLLLYLGLDTAFMAHGSEIEGGLR